MNKKRIKELKNQLDKITNEISGKEKPEEKQPLALSPLPCQECQNQLHNVVGFSPQGIVVKCLSCGDLSCYTSTSSEGKIKSKKPSDKYKPNVESYLG